MGISAGNDRDELVQRLVGSIHARVPQLVMEFAGAGSLALWWLHAVGGSSRTILEATDRYSPPSLREAVGFEPERFTSPQVAAALAEHAALRAAQLAKEGTPTFGVGLTAAIATDRNKRGEHRVELAVADRYGVSSYGLTMNKGARERLGEERLVGELVLVAAAHASGVLDVRTIDLLPGEELRTQLSAGGPAARFERGELPWLLVTPSGGFGSDLPADAAILSGSFNPVHDGHLGLAEAASRHLGGRPIAVELPLRNAEKAPFDLAVARVRANQFLGRHPVIISGAPLFTDKVRLYGGRTFVVGFDTARRLLEQRFYGSLEERDRAFEELERLGARFLVAGRLVDGEFQTLAGLDVPPPAARLFEQLPVESFREDISSSELRRRWQERGG